MRRQPNLLWIFNTSALLLVAAPPAAAQQSRTLCWRGPTADCAVILLTEIGYHHVLSTTARTFSFQGSTGPPATTRAGSSRVSWELGLLRPINAQTALGGSFEAGFGDKGGRIGMHVRARRFVTPHSSVEAALGFIRAGVTDFSGAESTGFNFHARYNLDDKLIISAGYDDLAWPESQQPGLLYLDDTKRARSVTVGAAAGSWPAAISTAVFAVGYVALAFLLAGST